MFFLSSAGMLAQEPEAFDLFASDSLIHLRITTDMKQLVKDKMDEEYQPAVLEIFQNDGTILKFDVDLRSRGNIRKEQCYYPPVKMKLPGDQFSNNKLKWVISCRNSDLYDQILLKEYLIYKMYEELTDFSFRTHLCMIEYIDTGRSEKSFARYAFVIENEDALANRVGGRVYEPVLLSEKTLQKETMAIFTFFEYMIANTDWHFKNRHNVEVIAHEELRTVLVIPYDFDYSGLVHTAYAVPNESVPVTDVTIRYNKGFCIEEDIAEKTRMLFLDRKDNITEIYSNFPYFDKATAREVDQFLDDFWALMENQKRTQSVFSRGCVPID